MRSRSVDHHDRVQLSVSADRPQPVFQWRELWSRRELLWLLADRDLRVRYRQTVVGVAWAVIQPLALLLILLPILDVTAPARSGQESPPWLRLYAGLVLWQVCAGIVTTASLSLQQNQELVSRVYFPRVYLPLSSGVVNSLDFLCSFCLLGIIAALPGTLRWTVLLAPVFVIWTLVFSAALGVGLCALNAMYRDVSSILPFVVQLAFFSAGIFYDVHALPASRVWMLSLNPMLVTIDGFRWSLVGGPFPTPPMLLAASVSTIVVVISGFAYFARIERRLADYL